MAAYKATSVLPAHQSRCRRRRMGKGYRISISTCFSSFFFSSRRRHTRFDCDWSSDVCSSDLLSLEPDPGRPYLAGDLLGRGLAPRRNGGRRADAVAHPAARLAGGLRAARRGDRESGGEGKRGDLGGGRILQKKKKSRCE